MEGFVDTVVEVSGSSESQREGASDEEPGEGEGEGEGWMDGWMNAGAELGWKKWEWRQ